MTSLGILVSAKLLNTTVPFIFSFVVDRLNTNQALHLDTPEVAVLTLVTSSLLGYGMARAGALGLNELRYILVPQPILSEDRRLSQTKLSEMLCSHEWPSTVSGGLLKMFSATFTALILVRTSTLPQGPRLSILYVFSFPFKPTDRSPV